MTRDAFIDDFVMSESNEWVYSLLGDRALEETTNNDKS